MHRSAEASCNAIPKLRRNRRGPSDPNIPELAAQPITSMSASRPSSLYSRIYTHHRLETDAHKE